MALVRDNRSPVPCEAQILTRPINLTSLSIAGKTGTLFKRTVGTVDIENLTIWDIAKLAGYSDETIAEAKSKEE